jgi:hypothetical protein
MRGDGWRGRLAVAALVAATAAGCSEPAPTAPAILGPRVPLTEPFDLSAGTYVVGLQGFDGSTDSRLPPCTPFGAPAAGKRVETLMTVTADGPGWIGRTVAPGVGALEMRAETLPDGPSGRRLRGTITGHAVDAGVARPSGPGPTGVRLDVEGVVDASLSLTAVTAFGTVTGRLRFSDAQGAAECSGVALTIARLP